MIVVELGACIAIAGDTSLGLGFLFASTFIVTAWIISTFLERRHAIVVEEPPVPQRPVSPLSWLDMSRVKYKPSPRAAFHLPLQYF